MLVRKKVIVSEGPEDVCTRFVEDHGGQWNYCSEAGHHAKDHSLDLLNIVGWLGVVVVVVSHGTVEAVIVR